MMFGVSVIAAVLIQDHRLVDVNMCLQKSVTVLADVL